MPGSGPLRINSGTKSSLNASGQPCLVEIFPRGHPQFIFELSVFETPADPR